MAKYRKVDPRIWNDAKFHALSDAGKLVFFLVLTHPHMTSLGAMRATIPGLASELNWDVKAFREAFGEGWSAGLVEHDEKAAFVGLPNFLKFNGPESPNVIRSWPVAWDMLPECRHKSLLLKQLKDFTKGLSEGYHKAWAEVEPSLRDHPSPIQEQEQEQEQEQDFLDHECASKKEPPIDTVSVAQRKFLGGSSAFARGLTLDDRRIRTLLGSAALLSMGMISEQAITSGCEAVVRRAAGPPRDPVAFFASELAEKQRKLKPPRNFQAMLAAVDVPDSMIQEWRDAT